MAFAVDAHHLPRVVDHREAVVVMLAIQLEKAGGDVDLQLLRQLLHGKDGRMIGGWPRAAEQALVLDPAEIMTFEQFGRPDDLRALRSCLARSEERRVGKECGSKCRI